MIRTLRLAASRPTPPDSRYFFERYSPIWCAPLARVFW